MAELQQNEEHDALNTGLAIRANRVAKLQALADLLERDLFGDSLWVTDVKQAGGELVYVTRFNAAEVEQYRKTLEQVQDEVGDKKPETVAVGDITVRFVPSERKP